MSKKPNSLALAIGLLGLALTGCASQIMSGYVGQTLAQPILDYGPPSTAYDMGDGQRAFVWVMRQQGVIPGYTTTTANASAYGSNGYASGNLYSTTMVMPPVAFSQECSYAIFARRTRTDIDGPAAWEVVGFRKPKLMCE